MLEFQVQFQNCPVLHCCVDNTDLGQKYYHLLQQQWNTTQSAIFRDPQKYTLAHFQQLADCATQELGWHWKREKYTLDVTTQLHKDLEQYLSQGYENIPEQHDELLHEIHFALHAIESGSRRNSWLQIEWFDDNGFELASDQYPAKIDLEFGDLRLQNPYVGHHPLYLYQQQDYKNITQTCRFHDFVKPGINLVIDPRKSKRKFDWEKYLDWFRLHGKDFLQTHGEDQLKCYTGHPVIGRVINLDDLEQVVNTPVLTFQALYF